MNEIPDPEAPAPGGFRARLNAWGNRLAELPTLEPYGTMQILYWFIGLPIGFTSGFLLYVHWAAGSPNWWRYLMGLSGGYAGAWLLRRIWPHLLIGIVLALILGVVAMLFYTLWLDVARMP